ncbi:MAG: hypothetical protein K2X55_24410 [Burkholderiaceae bacterium]|nr:hypothetical protein [Burkholderiaceae bacterium]
MRSTKYPQIPTTRSQLTTTVVLAIVFVIFIYFFNPDGHLPPDWKRYLTRAGGVLIMLGGSLGGYIYLHSENNCKKHALAEQALQEGLEDVRRLKATSEGSLAACLHMERLERDIADPRLPRWTKHPPSRNQSPRWG